MNDSPFKEFEHESGLWCASVNGDYRGKIWLRDSIFIMWYFMIVDDKERVVKALNGIGKLLGEIYGRFPICFNSAQNPVSIKNFLTGESADIQNDVLGELLWIYSQAKIRCYIFDDTKWKRIIRNILEILSDEHYWEQPDSGIWEMEKDVRASSIGICASALDTYAAISNKEISDFAKSLSAKGKRTLNELLLNETKTRLCDASLLYLIWPFRVSHNSLAIKLFYNLSNQLRKSKGLIRFQDDLYYQENNVEARWPMFLPHLSLAAHSLGLPNPVSARTIDAIKRDNFPESYVGKNCVPNKNTPLAWTKAMVLMAEELAKPCLINKDKKNHETN